MKLRTTTPASTPFLVRALIVFSVVVMGLAVPIQLAASVNAEDAYTERIRALERDIARYEAEASVLSQQAGSYQVEVNRLNTEKAMIQAQIDVNQAKHDQLVADIAANELKIKENQDALGTIIADLYVDDTISPVEMLASSTNIGDFLNKQEYRASTQDQLSSTITEIKELKKTLEEQKTSVANILKDQQAQRDVLQSKENEQQALLSQTRGDEAAFRQLSTQTQAQKQQLQREQQAAIERAIRSAGGGGSAVAGDPNKGGYPSNLANSNYYSPVIDPWGMFSRQCVSYTAWKVYQKNGYMPYFGGRGNANQWPSTARAFGIQVGTTPRAGSVGIIMAGQYGHSVWVENINSNGTINVSQYNYFNAGGPGWGNYSEMYNVSPGAYDYYIYF